MNSDEEIDLITKNVNPGSVISILFYFKKEALQEEKVLM